MKARITLDLEISDERIERLEDGRLYANICGDIYADARELFVEQLRRDVQIIEIQNVIKFDEVPE